MEEKLMPEWLTRDPLNGIVITLTFFISMVAGRYLREKIAEYGSKIIDPRIKILVSIFLITAATLMKHWYFPIAIAILCFLFAAKLNVIGDYSRKLVFPLVLALFIFALQSLTYGANVINLGIVSAYAEGIKYGFLIFSRVLASASVLILLVITTSEQEILESMRWFRIPKTMIQISSFMTRYIKTFSSEGKKLKLAQESRCGFSKSSGFTTRMHNIASISGALITRASARSEEVYKAMISRAWKPDLQYSMGIKPLDKRDVITGIVLSSGIFALLWFDRFL